MPLFKKKELMTDDEKKLSIVTFWLFVVALFAWIVPFTVLFVLGLLNQALGQGSAFGFALLNSLIPFVITIILCVIVYFAYKKVILKI